MLKTGLLLVLFVVGNAVADDCDVVEPAERLDCGYYGIQRQECDERGCCFDDTAEGVPYCFRSEADLDDSCLSIDVAQRADCGWLGIDNTTCESRGCCYDDAYYGVDAPYCFYPRDSKCYGIDPYERQDCGHFGIQREECENDLGCCFDHTVQWVPWCFIPNTNRGSAEESGEQSGELELEV